MNLSPRWIGFLSAAGISSVHWSAVGAPSAPDGEVILWAAGSGYTLLTNDLDFGSILAASGELRPSVIQLRAENLDPSVIGASLLDALRQFRDELESGALLSVDSVRARARLLPLARG